MFETYGQSVASRSTHATVFQLEVFQKNKMFGKDQVLRVYCAAHQEVVISSFLGKKNTYVSFVLFTLNCNIFMQFNKGKCQRKNRLSKFLTILLEKVRKN